jgi:hypothetical protein
MTRIRIVAATIVASLLLAGCGVSYDADLMASLEARWMCDVQRYTFEEVGDIQAELDSRLAGNGVTAEQYRAFKDDLIGSSNLRDQVANDFAAYCETVS